ncbi:MAG: hypothetical protein ACYTG5_07450 [Planctomycetota bacterium]|jgi:hypothetical protein
MEHTKHLWRAGLLVLGILVVVTVLRHFLIPTSFGNEGFYRADSRAEFMQLPVVHTGGKSCALCHADQYETHSEGKHAAVECEVCHAPSWDVRVDPTEGDRLAHIEDGEKINAMPMNASRELCALCHSKLAARPKEFPQVVASAHLVDLGLIEPGEPVPSQSCKICHPAHNPAQQ